jgi:hypothetical protein
MPHAIYAILSLTKPNLTYPILEFNEFNTFWWISMSEFDYMYLLNVS